jgi:hypothetical protein
MSPRDATFDFRSQPSEEPPHREEATATFPVAFDYLVLLAGCCFSLLLAHLFPLHVAPSSRSQGAAVQSLVESLPLALRLTEGVVLFWPFFFIPQKLRGRERGLTSAEWLWVFSWMGTALLTVLSAWDAWATVPGFLQAHIDTPRKLWYMIAVPSMALLALLLGLMGMVRRTPTPWTHSLSIALAIWPVLPLVGIVTLGQFA